MNRIITFLVCSAFFFIFFTPIRAFVSGGEALAMLIPTATIFVFDKMFLKPRTYLFLLVVAIIALLGLSGVPYFKGWIPDVITLSFGYFGLEHYLQKRDLFYAKWVLRVTYITLVGLVAISLPQFIAMPNLTRLMTAAANDPTIEFDYYWAVNYFTVHLIPTASIPLFVCFKEAKSRKNKIIYGISAGLMTVIMFFADATTPLILMAIIFAFFWIYNSKHNASVNFVKVLFVAFLLLPFLNKTMMVSMLKAVKPVFVGSSTYKKIDQMCYYVEHGESYGDMDEREKLYNITIDAIVANPLSPEMNKDKIGRHSQLLDHIAAMGIVLFIPYALFLYNRYKRPFKYLSRYKIYHIVSFLSFMIMTLAKGYFIYTTACFLVPMFLIYTEKTNFKKI